MWHTLAQGRGLSAAHQGRRVPLTSFVACRACSGHQKRPLPVDIASHVSAKHGYMYNNICNMHVALLWLGGCGLRES
eukprot:276370-Prymnesium_polylepis.1